MDECLEAYYSSDDDISCGPITLREIKRNLRQNIGCRPTHRVTIGYNTPPKIQNSEEDEIEDINDVIADISKLFTNCKYFEENVDDTSKNREVDVIQNSNKENYLKENKSFGFGEENTSKKPNRGDNKSSSDVEDMDYRETSHEMLPYQGVQVKIENISDICNLERSPNNREDDVIENSNKENSLIENKSFGFGEENTSKKPNRGDNESSSDVVEDMDYREMSHEMLPYQGVQVKIENISDFCNLERSPNNREDDVIENSNKENSLIENKSFGFGEENTFKKPNRGDNESSSDVVEDMDYRETSHEMLPYQGVQVKIENISDICNLERLSNNREDDVIENSNKENSLKENKTFSFGEENTSKKPNRGDNESSSDVEDMDYRETSHEMLPYQGVQVKIENISDICNLERSPNNREDDVIENSNKENSLIENKSFGFGEENTSKKPNRGDNESSSDVVEDMDYRETSHEMLPYQGVQVKIENISDVCNLERSPNNREDDVIKNSNKENSLIENKSFGFGEENTSKKPNRGDNESSSDVEDMDYRETSHEMLPYQGVQVKIENISDFCNLERSPNKSDMLGILAEEKFPEENFTTTSGNLSQNIGYRPAHRVTVGYNTPPRMQILEHELENINDVIADVSKLSTTCKYFREVHVSSNNRKDDFEIPNEENSLKESKSFPFGVDSTKTNRADNESLSDVEDMDYRETSNKNRTTNVDCLKTEETSYKMHQYQGVQNKNENISGVCNLERSSNKSDMSGILADEKSPGRKTSEIFPEERSPNTSGDEHYFNDTLEEIENLLENGLDYSMKCDFTKKQQISPIVPVASPKMLLSKRPQNLKKIYENVVSPVSTYIKSPGPFKLPMKPVKCSPIVQNNSRPPKNNYKNIASPVGTYIKYSSKAPLYQKVQNSPIQDPIKNSTCKKQSGDKENIKLPTVIYKPANFCIKYKTENEYNLPPSVKNCLLQILKLKNMKRKLRNL